MSRWFRLDDDIINDPKILLLPEAIRWIWVAFLCIASKNGGVLPAIEIIALNLRVKTTRAAEYLTRLVGAGLIDNDDGVFAPHNWSARQYKTDTVDETAAERMRRYRERKRNERNGDAQVTRTREQITDTETQTEKKTTRASALDDWPEDFGDQFWQAYPRKTEKISAMKRLGNVRKGGLVTFSDLMAGVKRYSDAVANADPQYTKHPTTWLNAGCWADETQPGGRNGARDFNPKNRSASSDFFAGMRSVAEDIAGDGEPSGAASEEIPRGRVNIEH